MNHLLNISVETADTTLCREPFLLWVSRYKGRNLHRLEWVSFIFRIRADFGILNSKFRSWADFNLETGTIQCSWITSAFANQHLQRIRWTRLRRRNSRRGIYYWKILVYVFSFTNFDGIKRNEAHSNKRIKRNTYFSKTFSNTLGSIIIFSQIITVFAEPACNTESMPPSRHVCNNISSRTTRAPSE